MDTETEALRMAEAYGRLESRLREALGEAIAVGEYDLAATIARFAGQAQQGHRRAVDAAAATAEMTQRERGNGI